MSDLSDQAQKLLGRFSKTVDRMKSAYSKRDKMMSVWADDLYAVEAVMSFLETIRDAPAQGEPVAWRWRYEDEKSWTYAKNDPKHLYHYKDVICEPLYASPVPSGQMNGEIKRPVQGWEVEVRINGGTALTIGHNHLCGMENIDEFKDVVENCGRHLIAFIGAPYERSPGEIGRNRDPIYAPDGKTWYQTALDEAAKRGENEVRIHHLESLVERGPLWCCHARGPDDVYAAPDYATALAWADTLNELNWRTAGGKKVPTSYEDCIINAVPALWPHSPEAHAEDMPKSMEGFAMPPLPSTSCTQEGGQ